MPPDYAAEMAPYLAMVGEFRVHYAGFFDPGFGHAASRRLAARAASSRCAATRRPSRSTTARSSAGWSTSSMAERPEILYGRDTGSNYQGQGLKLSKHFRAG